MHLVRISFTAYRSCVHTSVFIVLFTGQALEVDPLFVVSVADITAIKALVSWTVPTNHNNIEYRLQLVEEGTSNSACHYRRKFLLDKKLLQTFLLDAC